MYIYIDETHCHTHALELHYLQYAVAGSQWQTLGHDSSLTLTYLPPHTIQVAAMGALSHKASYHNGWLYNPCTQATVPPLHGPGTRLITSLAAKSLNLWESWLQTLNPFKIPSLRESVLIYDGY